MGIEQAAHLPNIVVNKKAQTRRLPNCFVTFVPFDAVSAQDPISTPVVYASDNPKWNYVTATNLPGELLDPTEKKFFILKVRALSMSLHEGFYYRYLLFSLHTCSFLLKKTTIRSWCFHVDRCGINREVLMPVFCQIVV